MPLSCCTIALTAGAILKEEKKNSLVGETQFSPFLARQKKKKDFPFSCGVTPSRTVPKNPALQVASSLLERVDLGSQKGGVDKAKKGKKGCAKEMGIWEAF